MTTSTQSTAATPDFTTINTWTSSDYALLTADLVGSMTPAQIQLLATPELIPVSAVSGLTADQMPGIISVFHCSGSWLNALTITAFQAMTPSQTYRITRPVIKLLDNDHLYAFTAAQVAGTNKLDGLSSAQFGLLNLTGMSASQIAGLTTTEFAGLTATQISSLSSAQVAAISNPGNLPLAAVSGFTANQMAALTVDFSTLSADWLNSLSPVAVSGLTATQAVAISVNFSAFSDSWLNALSIDAFRGLTTTQLGQLSTTAVDGLDAAHSSVLTDSLSSAQFGLRDLTGMSVSQIASLTPAEYAGLTATQISSLSPVQVAALSSIASLPLAAVSGLTAIQVAALSSDFSTLSASWLNSLTLNAVSGITATQLASLSVNLSAFSDNWLNALNTDAFPGLMTTQLSQLSTAILCGLDNAHLSALSATQVASLTSITSLSNAQFGLLDLSAVPASTMAKWSKSTWAGLTPAQVSSFSNAQINSFQSASWLPVSAAAGLLPSQMASLSAYYSQFSADWINHLQLPSFQALDNDRLGQISAATWAQIDVAHFSALNATQIAVIKLDFSTVSADWINSLTPATLQGLTTTQLGQLSAGVIAGLSDISLSAITVSQLTALPDLSQLSGHQFSLLNVSAMSNAQIAAWTPDQYATLTTAEFSTLSTTQIGAITNPAALPLSIVSSLTVTQVNAINTDFSRLPDNWLNSLSTTALQGLTPYQFSHLSTLTPAEVNNITSLAALSSAQFSQLNLTGMTATQIGSWSKSDCAGLTAQQITSLSDAQIHAMQHPDWMSASAAAGFTADKLASIAISLSWFSTDWLNNLSVSAFQSMTTTQLNQISTSKLSGVDNAHLSALSAAQVAAMTNLGSLACAKFGVLNISALSSSQLAALTLSQYQGLTQAQMSTLNPTQIQALAHPEWLSPGLFNNLSLTQVSTMTASQMASMSPGAISSLDAAHLAVWPGDVTAFTPEELLAVGPRLTDTQLNSLTDSQRSMLATSNSTAQALINSLSDASLKSIMQSIESGSGTLFSFNAIESVLKALDSGMSDVLSSSQYAGLQNYVQDIGQVQGTNSSVYSLINSLVNGANGASVDWTSPSDGTFTRIGSLSAGTSTTQFNQLIANWFDGTNEPTSSSATHVDGRPLFANGTPTVNDICQGGIGDCSFLSALQTVVNTDPDFIKSMFVQNSNNTYSVRFFNNGAANWVTVDDNVASGGASVSTSSWVAIAERASVAYEATYMNDVNSYSSLPDGFAKLQEITGDTYTSFRATYTTEEEWDSTDFSLLKRAVQNGAPAQLSSWVNSQNPTTGQTNFVGAHAFAIVGFDEATNDFVLTNPWGAYRNDNVQGTFEASMDEMWQGGNFSTGIAFVNSAGATGVVGQLVTAMASMTPAASASSASSIPQSSGSNAGLLVATHA